MEVDSGGTDRAGTDRPVGIADTEPVWADWRRPPPTPAQRRHDVLLGLGAVAGALVMTVLVNSMGAFAFGTAPELAEQLGWAVVVTAPLVVRRRFPLAVLLVVAAVFIAAQVRRTGDNLVPSIALFLALYTAGAWAEDRARARLARFAVIGAMLLWLGVSLVRSLLSPAPAFDGAAGPLDPVLSTVLYTIGFNLLYFAAAYFFGDLAWLSARTRAELEHRAEQLRRSQEENTRTALVAERLRIARDLHDIVAHHVAVMGIQAGAARRVLDDDRELARTALDTVESTARTAVEDLRGLLGVLRADDPDGMDDRGGADGRDGTGPDGTGPDGLRTRSSPGLADLPELVRTARTTGLRLEHGVYGTPRTVPDGVGLSAYRVVQEALTNIVRHAAARTVDVRVRFRERTLEVEITDDGRGAAAAATGTSGPGLGL
ncbi:sensor histidine kinase, partial [Saccharomonospora halophila]|uniref:sensor histidine kinase n=1 Tax=Saccharomonospora halophila TaxID=129922 RepID=UPI00037CEC98